MIPAHPRHLELRPAWDVDRFAAASKAVKPAKSSPFVKPSRVKPGKRRRGAPRGGLR